jgi:hypothetical protein
MARSSHARKSAFAGLGVLISAFLAASPLLAGGTPHPGNSALTTTNRNQLIGILGPDRGFGFGDYVTDRVSGLQRGGATTPYRFFVEVPPGQTQLVVQIFDAEVGGGDNLGTPAVNEDLHDQDNTTAGYSQVLVYSLIDPAGTVVATRTLTGQDCDPGVGGNQTFCDNTWSDLGAFTVASPTPGHWLFTVTSPNSALNDEDDANSFGLRAHDGDATAAGTEFNVYADTYIGLGHVYPVNAGADPGFSRSYDLYPFLRRDCSCDSNDWDSDSSAPIDESTVFITRRGATPTGSNGTLSGATVWRQNVLSGFASATDATDYGLWHLSWTTGRFNFLTYYMGDETAADPSNAAPGPGNGQEPNEQPEAGAIRLYFPSDGSTYFGLDGGANDQILPPAKPWVGQSWALLPGEPPIEANVTSIARVTITVSNPTDFPIQLSSTAASGNRIVATLPSNGGETVYQAGTISIIGGSSTSTSVTGTGPWTLTFAPGVIAANTTATLTYDVAITPTPVGLPKTLFLTGTGSVDGTAGAYLDETCANPAGGASACGVPAQAAATLAVGPLCPLSAPVGTAPAIAIAKQVNGAIADNGDGTFTVPFRLLVENLGTVTLDPVQVTDDLDATFPGAATVISVSDPAVAVVSGTGSLTANPAYDGSATITLLTAGNLDPGAVGQIDFSVTFDPNGLPGPFLNQAVATGGTPLGGEVDDVSDDGADPDADGDGNGDEAGENDPTPVAVGEAPAIGVAKRLDGAPIDNGDGTFTIEFIFVVENLGNVDLTSVQVTDNLALTFPAPASVVTVGPPVASILSGAGVLTANAGYNGTGNNGLLQAASSSLTVGAVGQIVLPLTFDADGGEGPFVNTATAEGVSPLGAPVSDISDDGTDPDPDDDGNGNEAGENDPTTIVVPGGIDLRVGIAKEASEPIDIGDGTFTVTFTLRVENLGNRALNGLEVRDDLAQTFPVPAAVIGVANVTASIVTGTGAIDLNPAYDGVADTSLTLATSTLDIASVAALAFDVTFEPGGLEAFENSANVAGSFGIATASDDSDDGTDPDPDGDGDATEDGENDPTPIVIDIAGDPPTVEIPTLDGRGLAAMALLVAAAAAFFLRRVG